MPSLNEMRNNGEMEGTFMDDTKAEYLINKWSAMLEDVSDPWVKRNMAFIFENEFNHLNNCKRRAMMEATGSGNIPDLVKFVFPVIKKVWPSLISNGLFSIQAMQGPIGGIFYWDFKYGTTKGTVTANQNMIDNFDRNYSSEYVQNETIGSGAANYTGTLAWKPVKGFALGQIGIIFTGVTSGGVVKVIRDVSGTGTLSGNVGAGSSVVYSSGVYDVTFDATVLSVKASYCYNMEAVANNVPQISIDIVLEAIKAISRKLKMSWSSESADDMRAVLSMDIEPQLTQAVASEINLGIDRELIDAAFTCGTTNTATWDAAVPPGRNQVDHYRNIMTVLEKVSGEINTQTHRGPGNFIVTGPSVQPVFGALATHGDLRGVMSPDLGRPSGQGVTGRDAFALPQSPTGYGIYPMGWLQQKWLVIIDPYFPSGQIMVGLKGELFTDSGLVYAPYIPMEMTQAFLDPADFTLRKGMRTRYAKKLVNSRFYGIISVTNLP